MSAIGPKRTSLVAPHMSAFGGKADMARKYLNIRQRAKMGVRSSSRTTNASEDAYLPCVS
jgi:hypothetical protein